MHSYAINDFNNIFFIYLLLFVILFIYKYF